MAGLHRIDHAENSRRAADTERKRKDRDRRKTGILPQHARGITQIEDEAPMAL